MKKLNVLTRMLLLVALLVGSVSTWGETSTLTFTAACGGSGTANDGAVWTVTSDAAESLFDSDRGIHYGTNSAQVSYIRLTTNQISGNITSVVVNAAAANVGSPKLNVTVGGEQFGNSDVAVGTTATTYTFTGDASGEIVVELSKNKTAKALYVKSIEVTYTSSPLASISLSGEYPTVFTEGDAFSHEGITVTATYENSTNKDVTASATFTGYDMSTPGEQTVTVSYTESEVTKTKTYNITVNAIPEHNAVFSVDGVASSPTSYKEGTSINFPEKPENIDGKVFKGWTTTAIIGKTNEEPDYVTSAIMGNSNVTFYAVFATETPGALGVVTDQLNRATTGITGTSYDIWSGKKVTSDAVYAGQSAGGNSSIQLRSSNSNSGIITTASGGKAKKIVVNWNSNTTSGRTLNIYGKNEAYTSASNLYDNDKKGTLLGSIVYGTSTELTVSGDYEYIGIRSNEGALYMTSVSIDWEAVTPATYSDYCTTVTIPATVTGTITEAGWNTFSCNYALDLSTISNGTTAYVATSASGSDVTLTKTTAIVEAGTGLMINGNSGDTFTINTTSDPANYGGGNLLEGLPNGGTVAKGANNYVFAWQTGYVSTTAGFYYVDSAEPTLPAGKAYLHTTTLPSGKLNIIIDDSTSQEEETDGIKAVSTKVENGVRYNLAGQKVGADYKGIVIVNGKKVIIK